MCEFAAVVWLSSLSTCQRKRDYQQNHNGIAIYRVRKCIEARTIRFIYVQHIENIHITKARHHLFRKWSALVLVWCLCSYKYPHLMTIKRDISYNAFLFLSNVFIQSEEWYDSKVASFCTVIKCWRIENGGQLKLHW